ncbi:MAG: aminopeptidase P family protein [Armatimonadetes bacterium]|nr:aminopeptidase P family protein [Armatimonadota bacterium]
MNLHAEKLAQASKLVADSDLGAWLLFVRETAHGSDPVLPLFLHGGLTWQSAVCLGADGSKVAIVGNYDADPLVSSGHWDEVVPYLGDIKPSLLEVLERCVPQGRSIGLNYSLSDDKADGLTHGMWLLVNQYVAGTRFEGKFVSAESLASKLRGQKTATELRLIRAAISEGDRLFTDIESFAKEGVSERAVFNHVHTLMAERGLGWAWDEAGDPIVNSGPDSMIGHGVPSDSVTLQPGHVFHVDLGVTKESYCSDVQRCWYVGDRLPPDVVDACDAVNKAIDAGAAVLRPGVAGWEVDAAGRASIVGSGYPEYLHALGHQVGRSAHDGGTVLAPKWERYGKTPFGAVLEGEVYTLELGVTIEGRGYLGIEEMVVVTAEGCEFLTERQLSIPCIQA